MYLADTSIWIDCFNGNASDDIQQLLLSNQLGLAPAIYTEILQGVRSKREFSHLKQVLPDYIFYHLKDNRESYEQAALIYFKCRKKGITIRSSMDCLIAQCAIENDVVLLHNDKDFVQMAGVISSLKQQYTGA